MTYDVPHMPGDDTETTKPPVGQGDAEWPLWEVFVRQRRGLSHSHCGSLRAPDADMAVQSARDVYTRRGEGVSVWVVKSSDIQTSDPDDSEAYFDVIDKPYRHATHYDIPDEVGHM